MRRQLNTNFNLIVMVDFNITTYNSDKEYKGFQFYILNKGLNSGKPLENPCPNCFVCTCQSEEEKNQLHWLMFGLWQGKIFDQHLVGSVIPFIHIRHIKSILYDALLKMGEKPEKFKNHINEVHKIEQNRLNILKQLELMKQLKRVLMLELIS